MQVHIQLAVLSMSAFADFYSPMQTGHTYNTHLQNCFDCQDVPFWRNAFETLAVSAHVDALRPVAEDISAIWGEVGLIFESEWLAEDVEVEEANSLWRRYLPRGEILVAFSFALMWHGEVMDPRFRCRLGPLGSSVPWAAEYLCCPLGMVAVYFRLWVMLTSSMGTLSRDLEELKCRVGFLLTVFLQPASHSFDYVDLSFWSLDVPLIAASFLHGQSFKSFSDYEVSDKGVLPAMLPKLPIQSMFCPLPNSRLQQISVAVMILHGPEALDAVSKISMAADRTPRFGMYLTEPWKYKGTPLGDEISGLVQAGASWDSDIRVENYEGMVRWWSRRLEHDQFLQGANMITGCSPIWVCTALHRALPVDRKIVFVLYFNMALLHLLGPETSDTVSQIIDDFCSLLNHPQTTAAVANDFTAELLLWQTGGCGSGARLPKNPILSLQLANVTHIPDPSLSQRLLVFRTKQSDADQVFLHILFTLMEPRHDFRLEFMGRVLSRTASINEKQDWQRNWDFNVVASYHAVLLLPHVPNAVALSDLYKIGIPLLVPDAPMIFRFIWPRAWTFGGHMAPGLWRSYRERAEENEDPTSAAVIGSQTSCPEAVSHLDFPDFNIQGHGKVSATPVDFYSLHSRPVKPHIVHWGVPDENLNGLLEKVMIKGAAEDVLDIEGSFGSRPRPLQIFDGPYNPFCHLDAYRYFYQTTEYAQLPGLVRFKSMAHLIDHASRLMSEDSHSERQQISAVMRAEHSRRLVQAMPFWTQAVARASYK